ncbi:MAG: hypothetical protein R2744_12910 [Bacteroidales bacterium]
MKHPVPEEMLGIPGKFQTIYPYLIFLTPTSGLRPRLQEDIYRFNVLFKINLPSRFGVFDKGKLMFPWSWYTVPPPDILLITGISLSRINL